MMRHASSIAVFSLVIVLASLFQSSVYAATPLLTLDYPRGGETFVLGTTQRVVLGPKLKPKGVKVELSRDGGANYETLGTILVVKGQPLSLSFSVAGAASGNCIVRVSDLLKPETQAVSAPFTIAGAPVSGGVAPPDGSVTTPKLADGSVTNPKIADLAVTSTKISSGQSSNNFILSADGSGNAIWKAPDAVNSVPAFSGALTGDVTGTQNATVVALVGGTSAANIAAGAALANAATNTASNDTLVKRDGSGNFSAGMITANFVGEVLGNLTGDVSGTASNVRGTVAVANGGTGQTSFKDGQLLIGDTAGNTLAKGTLTGTASQIIVTNAAGSITLSTPQDLATDSSPTFNTLTAASGVHTPSISTAGPVIEFKGQGYSMLRLYSTQFEGDAPTIIGGHSSNSSSGACATVAGGGQTGSPNRANGNFSFVGGGVNNTAGGESSVVGGGSGNTASGTWSTVAGGAGNTAAGNTSFAAGYGATIDAAHYGVFAFADGTGATFNSAAVNEFAARATGGVRFVTETDGTGTPTKTFRIAASGDVTSAGALTAATRVTTPIVNSAADLSLSLGGTTALRLSPSSTPAQDAPNMIAGFRDNVIGAGVSGSLILGGGASSALNSVRDSYCVVGGGNANQAGDGSGTVADKAFATVGGGSANSATGFGATIPGGVGNVAAGDRSFACGLDANVASGHPGTFLFSDSSVGNYFNSAASNEFAVRATGGVRLVTATTGIGAPTQTVFVSSAGNMSIGSNAAPAANAILELTATNKALVIPRMSKTQRGGISSPVAGMVIYQTDNTPGLRVYNGTSWMRFTETTDN